jgi:capsular exopolysaccharide synthesis family protein
LDYLRVLSRRKLVFLLIVVLVPATAIAGSLTRPPTYLASAEVLIRTQTLADSLNEGQQSYVDPARVAQTRAKLARVPAVVDQVLADVPEAGLDQEEFLKSSTVSTALDSDFLTFSVKNTDPDLAMQLATAYAQAFTQYEQGLETQALEDRLDVVRQQLADLRASGATGSLEYRDLQSQESQLAALAAVQRPSAQVVRDADRAPKVGPRTVRNGFIALFLGLVLALIVVFLLDALDTRVRSVDSIREVLGLRLLGRLPAPPSRLRKENGLVMLADPTSPEAEPFRVLRASLDFASADDAAQVIMISSGVDGEGKSTTAANLAVALARTGRRVVLIDADVGRPHLHRLFGLEERPGLTDLELGDTRLEEALRPIGLTDKASEADRSSGRLSRTGSLEVLPAGSALQDPDDLGFENAVGRIIQRVWPRADIVLVDTPPLLMSDAIALSAHVDAIAVVVRLKALRTSALQDMSRILEASPTAKLGFILTGVDKSDSYGHQRYASDPRPPARPRLRLSVSPSAANGAGDVSERRLSETLAGEGTSEGADETNERAPSPPAREPSSSAGRPFGGLSPSEAGKKSGQSRRARSSPRADAQERAAIDAAQDALNDR